MLADFGVFGGDERSCYLAAELARRGHRVITYALKGEDKISAQQCKITAAESLAELADGAKVLVGPVPFSRYIKNKSLETVNEGKRLSAMSDELTQENVLCCLKGGQTMFAGQVPHEFAKHANQAGVCLFDFLEDDLLLRENAVLTAEGCLAEVITTWPGKIRNSNVLVLGYGCCGSEIAKVFAGLSAHVTVCVRRVVSAWQAAEQGFFVCYMEGLSGKLSGQDIIINTVPSKILGKELLEQISRQAILVEIASPPGGFFDCEAEECGVNVLHLPGLPGKYCPRGAADAMADCLERFTAGGSAATL